MPEVIQGNPDQIGGGRMSATMTEAPAVGYTSVAGAAAYSSLSEKTAVNGTSHPSMGRCTE